MNNPIVPTANEVRPPAGFKLEYSCTCGMGCTPDELNTADGCEIEGFSYQGPSVRLKSSGGCQLSSFWSAEGGIQFRLSNYGYTSEASDAKYVKKPWTTAELEFIPVMIAKMLERIESE